ncbi:MAG: Mur ligase family protein [Caldilineaceae bacterium]
MGARIHGRESDTGFHVTTPDAPTVQAFLAQMRERRLPICRGRMHQPRLGPRSGGRHRFDAAAVTNITHEHIDWHQTRDAYVAARSGSFGERSTPHHPKQAPKVAVLNADDLGGYLGPPRAACALQALTEESAQSDVAVHVQSYGWPIQPLKSNSSGRRCPAFMRRMCSVCRTPPILC